MSIIPIIAILITCHNRKEKTLCCLQSLFNQIGLCEEFILEVFLVDDGSTDSTSETIRKQFPKVNIILGNGNLFWNRGMHLAWEAAADYSDFDYYMWLNDDTFLNNSAMLTLLQNQFSDSIIAGTTQSQINSMPTYGGYNLNKRLIVPNGIYQNCDYCNGNCVLIPKNVFRQIGNLDPIFHHALGDFDYCLRSIKLGFDIKVAPFFIGFCESHEFEPNWRNRKLPILQRLSILYSPISGNNPSEFFKYEKRHFGLLSAIYRYILIHIRVLVPFIWKFKNT
jgi:GT2 family glycosyltransferase